ncbi:MAG: sulfatase-like hydrolase/transferase, partial [Verrucomicrobiota bacterium]
LYYASHENHVPRLPHPRYAGRTPLGPRGDAVVAFDDQVGRILAELDRHGLAERTLVVVSSDNGPILDDGYKDQSTELNAKAGHEPAGPFRAGKYSILEGGTRVPFIVRWPGRAPAGKVSDALVSQVDQPASFLRLAGGDPAAFASLDSRDHSAALVGGAGRALLISSTQGGQLSIRDERWKYIPGTGQKGKGAGKSAAVQPGRAEDFRRDAVEQAGDRLFDLVADPSERRNLAPANPEVVARLKAALAAERAKGFNQPLGL